MGEQILPFDTIERCQSCGARARIQLDDGSAWCASCDDAARRMGYDDPEFLS